MDSFASNKCSIKGTKLIYINGVQTKEADAVDAKILLHESLNYSNFDDYSIKPKATLIHNFDESFALDVLESVIQKMPDSFLTFLQLTDRYEAFRAFLGEKGRDYITPQDLGILYSKYIQNFDKDSHYAINRNELKFAYESVLENDFRVLAVSHSQGGLFMEDSFSDVITDKKHHFFVGFQIASPILYTDVTKSGYATLDQDMIIKPIPTRWSNINDLVVVSDPNDPSDEYLKHGILSTYLFDWEAKAKVFELLYETTSKIESNCPIALMDFTYSPNGMVVNFDATDPDRPSLTSVLYNWDFGDGKKEITTSKIISHTYENPGNYNVILTLTRPDGSLFWEQGTIQKEVIISGQIQGCSGTAFGKNHQNPDGSIGGFVANTATVSATSHIGSSVSVCGNSQILGVSRLVNSHYFITGLINNSVIIDSNISTNTSIDIVDSTVSRTKTLGEIIFFASYSSSLSDVSIGYINMEFHSGNSIIKNSNFFSQYDPDKHYLYATAQIFYSNIDGMNFVGLNAIIDIINNMVVYESFPQAYTGPLSGWPY